MSTEIPLRIERHPRRHEPHEAATTERLGRPILLEVTDRRRCGRPKETNQRRDDQVSPFADWPLVPCAGRISKNESYQCVTIQRRGAPGVHHVNRTFVTEGLAR